VEVQVVLHASASSFFPHLSSPLREEERQGGKEEEAVCLVGCDRRARAYRPPVVTAQELMQQHLRPLVLLLPSSTSTRRHDARRVRFAGRRENT
jgi:hypothetical protein